MSTWTCINIKGQGHSLTLVQGHSDSTFSNFFSLETARLIEAKFHVEPPWDGGMKVNVTWPRWPPRQYMVKTFKNLPFGNQNADDLETWYAASSTTKFVQMMSLGWPWPVLLQGQVWSPILLWENVKTIHFFRNHCSLWYKSLVDAVN